ncbi:Hypothetical_protein [Hexamita inflata]|uniref:Hypothetical_protein n=1 Tax=Hexamita inflata TaxID=28002 RepID=A0AA86Q2U0_9EUKA|nr:Hypothetical protein HINF_LOCUS38794 [Hexamita inflata]
MSYNYKSDCLSQCTKGYCESTYLYQQIRYNCVANDYDVYNTYDSCNNNCYDGYCSSSYNSMHSRTEYECIEYTHNNSGVFALLFLLIPVFFMAVFTIVFCCKKRRMANMQKKVAVVQKQQIAAQNAVNQNQERAQIVQPQIQPTQINQNVTGVAPQGQLVTLPNGQVGIFIPLTQPQQSQVRQAQVQQPAPQFYQPQPIYQQQIYQQQRMVQEAPQTVPYTMLQMPIMPAINQ